MTLHCGFDFLEGRNTVIPAAGKTAAAIAAMDRQVQASSRSMSTHGRMTSQEIFRLDNAVGSSARRMTARALLIGGAFAAATGHAVALTAAIWPLVGALAAVPAVSVAGVVGLTALITGFSGLGAAMRKTGGGAGSSASQIAAAERRIEMAQRSSLDVQEQLNDAREDASDRLRDIATQYARAQLDVREAAQAVRDAQLAERQLRTEPGATRDDRARAALAVQSALLAQVEVANRLSDVEQEYQERTAKGVEGSDEVQQALRQQADAAYELAEAHRALAEAQRGGGGGGDDAYAKLSDSGKELVDTLRALGPEWRTVQQATQQALFAGVAGDMRDLSNSYLPVMRAQLPAIAQGWNNAFRSMAAVATMPGFVDDINLSLGNSATMWQRIGNAFGPFFSGFRHWVTVGSDFLPRLGSWVERGAKKFELWSAEVRESGKAWRWIDNAVKTGDKLTDLLGVWASSLFTIFQLGQDRSLLDNLIEGSEAFRAWLDTAEGQERITQMWERARDVGSAAWRLIKQGLELLSQADLSGVAVALDSVATVVGVLTRLLPVLNPVLAVVIPLFVAVKVAAFAARLAIVPLTLTFAALRQAVSLMVLPLNRFELATKTATLANLNAGQGMYATAAATAALGNQVTVAAAKTALAGLALAGLSVGAIAAGAAMMGNGGTIEGAAIMAIGLTGLVSNITSAVLPAISAMIARLGLLRFALLALGTAGVIGLIITAFVLLGDAMDALDPPTGQMTGKLRDQAAAFTVAAGALDTYTGKLKEQTDPLFAFMNAQDRSTEAQKRYNEAVAEFGANSPQATDAAHDLAQAEVDLIGATEGLTKVAGPELLTWLDQLHQDGLISTSTLETLKAQIESMPGAIAAVNGTRLQIEINRVFRDQFSGPAAQQYGGAVFSQFHDGGVVPGPPGKEMLALVQGGEMVTPYDEVQKQMQGQGTSGVTEHRFVFDFSGADTELGAALEKFFRRRVRTQGRGSAQVYFAGA